MLGLIALLIFLTLLLAGYATARWVRERDAAKAALAQRLESATGVVAETSSLLKDQRLSTIGVLNGVLARLAPAQTAVRMIQQARIKRRVGEVLLYIPLLATIGFLLVTLIS